jgi:hypothetical protein
MCVVATSSVVELLEEIAEASDEDQPKVQE